MSRRGASKKKRDTIVLDRVPSPVRSRIDPSTGSKTYTTRIKDDGRTRVIFGDGKRGARPSAGSENIRAKYGTGIGEGGIGGIQPLTKGTKDKPTKVRSPRPSTGGIDPSRKSDLLRRSREVHKYPRGQLKKAKVTKNAIDKSTKRKKRTRRTSNR